MKKIWIKIKKQKNNLTVKLKNKYRNIIKIMNKKYNLYR